MYSEYLQEYVQSLSTLAQVPSEQIGLLNDSLIGYLGVLSHSMNAEIEPPEDMTSLTVRLLLMSDALSRIPENNDMISGAHYLVALGFEQSSTLLARQSWGSQQSLDPYPLDNDHYYRLMLAFLHYMCGGNRVQATAVLNNLERFAEVENENSGQYASLTSELHSLFSGAGPRDIQEGSQYWTSLIDGEREPANVQERHLRQFATVIHNQRTAVLNSLGRQDPAAWLSERSISGDVATDFWRRYLERLIKRGITAFTNEQIGPGFEHWLTPTNNLLVTLPTGAGKSIIGELSTALEVAVGNIVVWLLPTRALVRQVKRDLRNAFLGLPVQVDVLPMAEDYLSFAEDEIPDSRYVAVSTPEKLSALLRQNPSAAQKVSLVVVDEAHLLFEPSRGIVLESTLMRVIEVASQCRLVFMTAAGDYEEPLRSFAQSLSPNRPLITLSSLTRPTRRINGIVSPSSSHGSGYARLSFFPAGVQGVRDTTAEPINIHLRNVTIPKSSITGLTDIGSRTTRSLTRASVRTVLFVERRDSTESQARKISKARPRLPTTHLDDKQIARLEVELGRESVIVSSAKYRIAPHHAGLTGIEQHTVEGWLARGTITTIVATATLAQGVNLPFDASIVTFTARFNNEKRTREELPVSEVQNMLGRAGRAGRVSDGLCLLARVCSDGSSTRDLDASRRYFFRHNPSAVESFGIENLLRESIRANANQPEWLLEISGIAFAPMQALLSDASGIADGSSESVLGVKEYLSTFQSLQNVGERFLLVATQVMSEIVDNLRSLRSMDQLLLPAIHRTGMPPEVIAFFLATIRQQSTEELTIAGRGIALTTAWMDATVLTALNHCRQREWLHKLLRPIDEGVETRWDPPSVVRALQLWRSGATIAQIEHDAHIQATNHSIEIGTFLNQRAAQFAQLWGALSVCLTLYFETEEGFSFTLSEITRSQTYVREGVEDLTQLLWLRNLGGLDRVLAHRLAGLSVVDQNPRSINRFIRGQIDSWHKSPNLLPQQLSVREREALTDVLRELRSE